LDKDHREHSQSLPSIQIPYKENGGKKLQQHSKVSKCHADNPVCQKHRRRENACRDRAQTKPSLHVQREEPD